LNIFDRWAADRINSVDEISYRKVIKPYAAEQNQEYAPKTVEGRLYAVKKLVDEAVADKIINIEDHPFPRDWSPSDMMDSDPSKTQRQKFLDEHGLEEGVSEDEWRAMRANVDPPRSRNQCIIDMMWVTGGRASEVAEIKLDDIDFDKRIIRNFPDRKKKDPDATREPKFGAVADAALDAWKADRGRYECLKDADEEWLFCSRKTAPMYPERVEDAVIDAAKNAGIQKVIGHDAAGRPVHYITSHSFRHGHGTYAIDDVGVHRVMDQLGHSSVELTKNTYIHTKSDDESNPYHGMFDE
jgi:integrase/recombinase XerD